jgi:GT2 family glycosyltransferase
LKTDFSLVIPTLYGTELEETLIQIHQGTYIPSEIIIVIPSEFQKNIDCLKKYSNIKILGVDFSGQVLQRIFGFKHASNDIVIQLDDDIFVDLICFENLIETLQNSDEKIAVAPLLKWKKNKESCYIKYQYKKRHLFIHGEKLNFPGKITKTGWNTGFFHSEKDERYIESEWLPGGCVAHSKKNLILENYYPFEGKAYFEDVFHSIYLNRKGVKLIVDNKSVCFIDEFKEDQFDNEIKKFYFFRKYRIKLIQLLGLSLINIQFETFVILIYNLLYNPFKRKKEI